MRIGILVFDNFEPIDVWGFAQAFTIARTLDTTYASPPPHLFQVLLISPATGGTTPAPVACYGGPRVAPDLLRDQALGEVFDVLMVPGGLGVGPLIEKDGEALRDWIRAMNKRVRIMASVCTGAAVLADAGLLDGLPAATNHAAFEWVAQFGPKVLWDSVARWVDAGRFVTSAGVSAGIDLGFYLVQRLAGRAIAERAAISAEYDWHRDPNLPIFYPQQAAST